MTNQKGSISIMVILAIIALLGIEGYVAAGTEKVDNFLNTGRQTLFPQKPVLCTQEAKLCADGSYVGRTGPNCEFAACSSGNNGGGDVEKIETGISGKIFIGPTCPVIRIGEEDKCGDKPYQGTLVILKADGETEVAQFTTDAKGEFNIQIAPGNYIISSLPGTFLPRCYEQVKVIAGEITQVLVSCDSGIR